MKLICSVCGLDTSPEAMTYPLAGLGPGQVDRSRPDPAWVFCSERCFKTREYELSLRPVCLQCHSPFERPNANGRKPVYCSDRCRNQRRRALDLAWKHLAQGSRADPKPKGDTVEALEAYRDAVYARYLELLALVEYWNDWRTGRLDGGDVPVPDSARREARSVTNAMSRASFRLVGLMDDANKAIERQRTLDRAGADVAMNVETYGPKSRRQGEWERVLADAVVEAEERAVRPAVDVDVY